MKVCKLLAAAILVVMLSGCMCDTLTSISAATSQQSGNENNEGNHLGQHANSDPYFSGNYNSACIANFF